VPEKNSFAITQGRLTVSWMLWDLVGYASFLFY